MKKLIPIIVLAVVLGSSAAYSQLRLTALFDGPLGSMPKIPATDTTPEIPAVPGRPRGIELYAFEDIDNLRDYGINVANINDTTPGRDIRLPAMSLSAGSFFYISREEDLFEEWFGFKPDHTANVMNQINGTWGVELPKDDIVIDVFGDVTKKAENSDAWKFVDSWAYRMDETGPDGSTFNIDNWILPGRNVLDDETSNSSSENPVPIGTYTPEQIARDQTGGVGVTPEPSTYGIIFSIFAVGLVVWRKRNRRIA